MNSNIFFFTKNAFDEMQCPLKIPELKKFIDINFDFGLILETEIIEFSLKNNIKIIMIIIIIVLIIANNIY